MKRVTVIVQAAGGKGFASRKLVKEEVILSDDEYIREFVPHVWLTTKGRVIGRASNTHHGRPVFTAHGQTYLLHRALAEAFLPGVGDIVRHLDDDPHNNCLSNLAWGTRLQNNADARRNGLLPSALTEGLVRAARLLVAEGFSYATISRFVGVKVDTLHKAVVGDTWAHVQRPGPVKTTTLPYSSGVRAGAVIRVKAGESAEEVAASVGCALSTVYEWLKAS